MSAGILDASSLVTCILFEVGPSRLPSSPASAAPLVLPRFMMFMSLLGQMCTLRPCMEVLLLGQEKPMLDSLMMGLVFLVRGCEVGVRGEVAGM